MDSRRLESLWTPSELILTFIRELKSKMDGLLGSYAECEGTDEKVERLYQEWLGWSKRLDWEFIPTFPFTQSEVEYLASNILDGLFAFFTRENRDSTINLRTIFEWLCIHGWLKSAQWLVENFQSKDLTKEMRIRKIGLTVSARAIFRIVALNGELDVLKWLYQEFHITFDYKTIQYACSRQHFDIVKWLLERDTYVSQATLFDISLSAINVGDLEMVQWLHKRYTLDLSYWQEDALMTACRYDYIDLFRWLNENFRWRTPHSFLFIYACSCGSLKTAQYLFETYPFLNKQPTLYRSYRVASDKVREWLPYRPSLLPKVAQWSLVVIGCALFVRHFENLQK